MSEEIIRVRATEFAGIILALRQRFNEEEIGFLRKTQCLSVVQLKVLLIIASQGPCTMGEVAKKVPSLSLSSITVIVDKLVKTGFVGRVRSDADRRVVRVALTDEGKEMFVAYQEEMVKMATRLLVNLTDEEQEFLLGTYRKIVKTKE